ncbi:hypothetical protein Pint_13170 [Pistacia integerrima]|uniref:Uncharacterized protein n=1 Tax=Pistacia integerrima TaxID=434235 RepID=A0ACC0Y7U1_9ROSI|nr:hypothetical protein Pint_13170 [Pistacia integerrima]
MLVQDRLVGSLLRVRVLLDVTKPLATGLWIGHERKRCKEDFIETGYFPAGINETFIALVPKVDCPESMILFLQANEAKAYEVKEILNVYSIALGKRINLSKSSLIFSCNMINDVKEKISRVVSIPCQDTPAKYLGNPFTWGKTRTQTLSRIRERVGKKSQ